MKIHLPLFLLFFAFQYKGIAQINKGINFQGIARNNNGLIIANKVINLRLSIQSDSINGSIEYQEIKSVTTNVLGLFSVVVGEKEDSKINSIGNFSTITWGSHEKYLQIEVDITGDLSFINLGLQKINYVPLALYAEKVAAKNIQGLLDIGQGGTGFDNTKDVKISLALDKVNNTPDSLKPISIPALLAINDRLKKSDTVYLNNRINLKLNAADTSLIYTKINALPKVDTTYLSNRINLKLNASDSLKIFDRISLKLNKSDTLYLNNRINLKLNAADTSLIYTKINTLPKVDTTYLSNRINLKLNKLDTISLSNRIDAKIGLNNLTDSAVFKILNYIPIRNDFGVFYDTSKITTPISTATSIKWGFTQFSNNISITNNTSGLPSRITVLTAGIYSIRYSLQFIKPDIGADELSVWIRRNSAACLNTHNSYPITGSGVKNLISTSFFVELGEADYVEIYFSVKNLNTSLAGSSVQSTPSRPATPAAMVTVQRVN